MTSKGRVDIRSIFADPVQRRQLMAHTLKATQAREGREMTWARAYEVVDQMDAEKAGSEPCR